MAQKELLNVLPLRRFDENRGCGTAPSLSMPRQPIVRVEISASFKKERERRENKVNLLNYFLNFSFQRFKSMISIYELVGVVGDLRFETICKKV